MHNGIRLKDYKFRKKKKNYLLFLGRIMKEKGVHLAIKVAKKQIATLSSLARFMTKNISSLKLSRI